MLSVRSRYIYGYLRPCRCSGRAGEAPAPPGRCTWGSGRPGRSPAQTGPAWASRDSAWPLPEALKSGPYA